MGSDVGLIKKKQCHIVIEDALWLTSWSDVSLILIIVTDNWDQIDRLSLILIIGIILWWCHMLTFTDRLIWHAQLFHICLCYQDQTQWSTVKWNPWSIRNCHHVLLNFAASLASSSSVGSNAGPTAWSHHQSHGQGGSPNGCDKSIRIDIIYSYECRRRKWYRLEAYTGAKSQDGKLTSCGGDGSRCSIRALISALDGATHSYLQPLIIA